MFQCDGGARLILTLDGLLSIDEREATNVMREVSKEEVWHAVKSMKPFKAPGSNRFQAFFFKKALSIIPLLMLLIKPSRMVILTLICVRLLLS